jgi:uroporphyrinogen decarboxylase
MNLYDLVLSSGRRWVAPMAAPLGARLIGLEAEELRDDEEAQSRALHALLERFRPDILFPLMDLAPFGREAAALLRGSLGERPFDPRALKGRESEVEMAAEIDVDEHPALLAQARVMEGVGVDAGALRACFLPGPFHLAGSIFGVEELILQAVSGDGTADAAMGFAARFLGVCAGALAERLDLVMLVEPELGTLYPPLFQQLCLPYLEGLCGVVRAAGAAPMLRAAGDCSHLLEDLVPTGAEGISLDHQVDMKEAARTLPLNLIILGNLEVRRMRRSSPTDVRDKAGRLAAAMSGYRNFVLSTSGELEPGTPLENLEALFAAGRA